MPSTITCADIIAKRKARWEQRHDIEYDRQLVAAAADKILSTQSLRDEIIARPYLLIPIAFYIVDKKRNTVPFFFNDVQQDFINQLETKGTSKPYFVLKGRQQGFTSVITAIQLAFAIVRKNFSGFTMADRSDNTVAIFNDKARTVYDRLPEILKPSEKFNSRNEMFFDKLNSSWRIATATSEAGRSRTLNFVHFSEVAFYECDLADLQAGIGEAITADAIVVYETTANGFNQAKDLWDSGACVNLFYEWWRSPEYRSTEYEYIDKADTWLTERIKLLYDRGCDREQVAWYAKKYDSYLDKSTIRQEYPITPEEAFIFSGDCVFDIEKLNQRMVECSGTSPIKVGFFDYKSISAPVYDSEGQKVGEQWQLTDIRFIERQDGYIRLHREPEVKKDGNGNVIGLAPYALGGDTAESGQDWFAGKMVNAITGQTAATFHKQFIDEDLYAEQMLCLAKYYHDALIGIEINYSREPMRIIHRKYGYINVYLREKLDGVHDEKVLDIGFRTDTQTRRVILGELVAKFRENPAIECDIPTLREMSTFVKKQNGRQEAIDGQHDDLVMSLAIAHYVAGQQSTAWIKPEAPEDDFIKRNFKEDTEADTGYYANSQTFGESGSFMNWDDF